MATNLIQGINAVLSFKKGAFIPFLCASDISIEINTATESVRTIGDGIWDKQKATINSYNITFSGLIKFDFANFTGWDMVTNQIGWTDVEFLISFTDDAANVKSYSGFAVIQKSAFSATAGQLVKDDFTLAGNGALKYFDGLVPCPTSIDAINITGQDAADNIIHVAYFYTGAVYQVKYRIDGLGSYTYAIVDAAISIPGLSNGLHSIEMIPICVNGYEGIGLSNSFTKTGSLTCSLAITSITHVVTGSNVAWTINYNADPSTATLQYNIDGGTNILFGGTLTNPMTINTSLAVGVHSFNATPICSNNVPGTGNSDSATVTSGSTVSTINYSFTAIPGGSPLFQIYVNGGLVISINATASGSITALTGQNVKALVQVQFAGRDMSLKVDDSTTAANLYNNSQITPSNSPVTDQFTWAANGDTFAITSSITP